MQLRDYQLKSIADVRKKYIQGCRKVLLVAPTGAGKTAIFCEILKATNDRGKKAIMVVRGRHLVDQGSERLDAYGVDHGVYMANHWRFRPDKNIQVCSIDTLYRRKIAPEADLVVIDEAHTAQGDSYRWLLAHYPEAYFLPVTATPFVKRGLRHIADDFVEAASMQDLIKRGFLVPLRYYCPSSIDISNVSVDSTGDFNTAELFEAADNQRIYGELTSNYLKLNNKTALVFGVNVSHATKIAEAFSAAGVPTEVVTANTPLNERKSIIEKMRRGEIKIISSVGTMTTGVDIPALESLIIARPTKSLNLHIQMIGRVTRTHAGKQFGLVFDHAGNVLRHGLAEFSRTVDLDGHKPKENQVKPIACLSCLAIFCPYQNYLASGLKIRTKRYYVCPYCKYDNTPENTTSERSFSETNDELVEITDEQIEILKIRSRFDDLETLRRVAKSKKGAPYNWRWTFHKLVSEYGIDKIKQLYPKQMKACRF